MIHKKVMRYSYSKPSLLRCFFANSSKVIDSSSCCTTPLCTAPSLDLIHKGPYFCDSLSGLPSFCSSDSNPIKKLTSLNSSSCGLHPNCRYDSNLLHKMSSFSHFSSGTLWNFHLFNPSFQYLKKLAMLKGISIPNCSVSSSFGRDRRAFSVSSSDVSVRSELDSGVGFGLNELGWKRKGKGKGKGRRVDGSVTDLVTKVESSIIEIIRSGEDDMELKLSSVASTLSLESITEIFQVLNCQRMSGLRFFRWVRDNNPRLYSSADFVSLIINNCGCLDDYDTMLSLLNEFKMEKICLHENAFWFLPVLGTSQSSLKNSIGRLVDLLNEVGGSCRSSGICALIETFCKLDLIEMAKHVMQITEKKSHYDILVRQRCKQGHSVCDIIQEMTEFGYKPTVKTLNYLVGSLCKQNKMTEAYSMLETMEQEGVHPDASTFEIFIHKSCNSRNMDLAKKFLNTMVNRKLEPRLETHAAVLKALFRSEQYAEARNYVIDSSVMYKNSTSMLYSLLADLHLRRGDIMSAQGIIVEMMDGGHRPNFQVYITIVKKLEKIGQDHLARDIQNLYSSFLVESNTATGSVEQ